MKVKILIALVLATVSSLAVADQYVCTVYCDNGKTQSVVDASSSSDAANQLDSSQSRVNQICQDDNRGNASTSSLGSSQCSRQ